MITSSQTADKPKNFAGTANLADEVLPLPTATDVLAFLQQSLGVEANEWLLPVGPFAANVPALSGNILELHFDKPKNNVDFAARLNRTYDSGMIAGVKHGDYNLPFLPNSFASLLHQNGNTFKHGVENIWIEYDDPFTTAPALFFDINSTKPFDPQKAHGCLQEIAYTLDYCVRTPLLRFLKQIREEELWVIYFGLMFSRKTSSVRLTIHGTNSENIAGALHRLGWKGNYKALEKIRSRYLHKGQKLVIGVDFGTCLEARIGIEVFDQAPRAFIQKLYGEECINKAWFEGLKAWEQIFALPNQLANALTELHQRPVTELHTRINHFKFVLDETKAIRTKAYLYYCF